MGIDSLVWLVLLVGAILAIGGIIGQIESTAEGISTDLEGTGALLALVLWLALAIGYHTVLEWRFGQTIGKYLVAIEVITTSGKPCSLPASLGRNVARLMDWLPAFYMIGIVSIIASEQGQRLGDHLGNTVVVRP